VFEAIESSDMEHDAQNLTDRQREVAERQQMDAGMFANISSSSRPTSKRKTDEKKPQIQIDSDMGIPSDALVGSSDPGEPESSPPSSPQYAPNHLQSDDQNPPPSSPTAASVQRKSEKNSRENSQATPKKLSLDRLAVTNISSSPPPGACQQPELDKPSISASYSIPVDKDTNQGQLESAPSTSQASTQDTHTKVAEISRSNTSLESQRDALLHDQHIVPDSYDGEEKQDAQANESMEDVQTIPQTNKPEDLIPTIGHLTPNSSFAQENILGTRTSTRNSLSKRRRQTGSQVADDDETPTAKKQKVIEVRSTYSTRSASKRSSPADGPELNTSPMRDDVENQTSKALGVASAPSVLAESFTSANSLVVCEPTQMELVSAPTPIDVLSHLEGLLVEAKSVVGEWSVQERVRLADLAFEIQALSRGVRLD
jgi:hypothetical protein